MNNFSIIIPAYNEEKTIGKVVKEACQTKADEIIVVDDASRDNTSQIVLNLQKTDKRIILVRNKLNKGPGGSRKIGLLKSTKDIVLFFDADIKNVNKIMFEKLVFPIIRNKADLVMAAFDNFGRITE
ncbi:MAG: glycosyltransferase family 2 protein, partial [Candidatus Hadarchaeum sp.]